jgi:hypothetical protein
VLCRELLRESRPKSQEVGRKPQKRGPDHGSHGRVACKPLMGLGAPFPKTAVLEISTGESARVTSAHLVRALVRSRH